jgi:hypothetical protein
MFSRLSNSWELIKESARVLQADKELLVFPIVSAIGTVIVSATFIVPMFLANFFDSFVAGKGQIFGYVLLFLFYLAQYFVIFFANTALVGAAMIRLRGGDPNLGDGFRIAFSHFWAIFGYALIAATVGMILKAISRRSNTIGRLIVSLLGLAWNLATFLVVPVLAVEDVGPIEAIKRSVSLLKKTWGEQIIGNIGLGAVFGLINLAIILIGIVVTIFTAIQIQSIALTIVVAFIFIFMVIIVGLVNSALSGIYTAAVYQFAVEGKSSGFFDESLIRQTFRSRSSSFSG